MKPLADWHSGAPEHVAGIFTDIDDTLTTEGAITPDALQALADLKTAGLMVIPITGRPIGWCERFMAGPPGSAWPVDAMVAENGAVAFVRGAGPQQPPTKLYQQDAATRHANQVRLRDIAARVAAEVPGVELSRDSAGRETDIAFDYAEFARHSPETVQQVLAVLEREGLQTTVSSIHIHGCFGDFNKWQGANWIVRELLGRDLAHARLVGAARGGVLLVALDQRGLSARAAGKRHGTVLGHHGIHRPGRACGPCHERLAPSNRPPGDGDDQQARCLQISQCLQCVGRDGAFGR